VIELGVPFTDPMADGPTIQRAAMRALEGGMTLRKACSPLAKRFRVNPCRHARRADGLRQPVLHHIGYDDAFAKAPPTAGADGVICVDIPPEEDTELREARSRRQRPLLCAAGRPHHRMTSVCRKWSRTRPDLSITSPPPA
jgi:tryptophan synthase alpha chain